MTTILLIGFGLLALSMAGLALYLARRRPRADDGLSRTTEKLEAGQQAMAGRLAQLNEDSRNSTAALAKSLEERLDKMTRKMGQSLEESASRTGKTIGELQARLAVIDEAQKRIAELSGQVVGLQDILSNKQSRGAFGEIQLNDLVINALPPSAYDFQVTLSNGRRADCLIRLPIPPGPIVIDAKFPLESYRALNAAGDDERRLRAGRAFAADVTRHVRDIADKYILAGETAESALMFLPSEAVYAELHARFTEVLDKSYRAHVWIVSPTTLMATLHTVRAVLKDAHMREAAGVIQKEVMTLLGDVARLDNRVASLKTHFSQAGEDIRKIGISSDKITSRAERIEEMQIEEAGEPLDDLLAPKTP